MAERRVWWSLWSICSHFSMKLIGKKHDFKNALKKKFSWQKSLTHCINLYTTIWWLATHQPSHPKKHAISGVQSGWAATTWPILCHQYTTRAVSLTKCRFNLPSPKLPSSGLMEFYVSQMVCVCFYSLYKIVHYTCNVETLLDVLALPSDSPRPLLGRKNSLDDLYSTYNPPSVWACWQGSLPPL